MANTGQVLENTSQGYLTTADWIKGGYVSFASLAAVKDKIIAEGMLVYITSGADQGKFFVRSNNAWVEKKTTATDIGLGNCDNTSDADKPISTAQATVNSNLQEQIDEIKAKSDVVDVVATKAALNVYDTSKLGDNDIVKVLKDESLASPDTNATAYYRYNATTKKFVYINCVGPYALDSKVQLSSDTLTVGTGSIVFEIDNTTKTLNIKITAQ